jgi:hypothetical protein
MGKRWRRRRIVEEVGFWVQRCIRCGQERFRSQKRMLNFLPALNPISLGPVVAKGDKFRNSQG